MMLNFGLLYLQKSSFRFPLSIIISRVQHFWSAIERFNCFKKIATSKQKQLSKIRLCSFVAQLSLVNQSKFYANRVNSWLVIQNSSDPCRIQAHGATHELHNQRKCSELQKSCLLSRRKVAGMECRTIIS